MKRNKLDEKRKVLKMFFREKRVTGAA